MRVVEIKSNQQNIAAQTKRLAAYCRVSSDSKDQLNSFAAQIKYYTEYIKKNPEYELVDIYADEGISGTDMHRRNEFNRLLSDCKRNKIDRIITKSISRFARNTKDLLVAIRMLKELGVSVYFEEQGIDSSKINVEMFVTLPGMAAQQESISISENMRWSYQKRMQSGEYIPNSSPYGYTIKKGELIINEAEAEIVRRIFDMYLSGIGKQRIANILNDEKIPSRKGNSCWHVSAITYILNNERYIGDALLQKSFTTDTLPFKRKQNKGQVAQYYVENANTPIISKEVFNAVQKLQNRRMTNTGKKQKYPLSNFIQCPDCGKSFRRQTVNNTAYWICSSKASGRTNCTPLRLKEDDVYNAILRMMQKLKDSHENIILPTIKYIELLQNKSNQNHPKIFKIDKQIADLCAQNHILTKLRTKGILDISDYSAQASNINDKIMKLRIERREILHNSEDFAIIEDLKHLDNLLIEYTPSPNFNEDLFNQVVKKILVINNQEISIMLIGNLTLKEKIQ